MLILSCGSFIFPFVWNILLGLLILFDFRFLFLWIRQNSCLSWSWRIGLIWECPLCRLLVLGGLTGRLELEQVLARCSPWVNAPQGSWRWSSLGWGQSLRSTVPVSTLTGRLGLGGVLRGLKLWFLLVLPTSELTLVIS